MIEEDSLYRIRVMKSIKSKGSKIESKVSRTLWSYGLRFRKNVKDLEGVPDIAIKKYKLVIFVDSCFWHGCNEHCRYPKSNRGYWMKKIKRNKDRDKQITEYYKNKGWNIIRIWEHDINHIDTIWKEINAIIHRYNNN